MPRGACRDPARRGRGAARGRGPTSSERWWASRRPGDPSSGGLRLRGGLIRLPLRSLRADPAISAAARRRRRGRTSGACRAASPATRRAGARPRSGSRRAVAQRLDHEPALVRLDPLLERHGRTPPRRGAAARQEREVERPPAARARRAARARARARARSPARGSAASRCDERRRGRAATATPNRSRVAREEVAREHRDVLGPLAQRRQPGGAPRRAGSRGPRGSARRGPRSARSRWVAARTRTSTLRVRSSPTGRTSPSWRTRRSFACASGGELADLVEEERPAVGLAEQPRARAHRAGEGAPRVAEQLGLGELRRERRAVEAHERPVRARRDAAHDRLGDPLLAGPALAGDEHRHVARRRRAPTSSASRRIASRREHHASARGRARRASRSFSCARRAVSSARRTTARSSSSSNGFRK